MPEQNDGPDVETTLPGTDQQEPQQQTTPESGGNGQQQQESTATDETRLPDSHPLVKAYRAQLEENRRNAVAKTELAEARAQAAQVTKLQDELGKRPTQEAMDTLQTRYERLEAFAQAVGLGRALDSRTFTRDLFESDKDVATLVKEWNKANPTATSAALGSTPTDDQGSGRVDPNVLLRIAAGKQ